MGFTLIYNTTYKDPSKYLNPDLYAYTDCFYTILPFHYGQVRWIMPGVVSEFRKML